MSPIIFLFFLLPLLETSDVRISFESWLRDLFVKAGTVTSEKCSRHLNLTANGLINFQPWAWKMLDSMSKIPAGIFEGNVAWMGNFDECVSSLEKVGSEVIEGKFCKGTLSLGAISELGLSNRDGLDDLVGQIPLSIYLCVSKACDAQDLNSTFQNLLIFDEEACSTKEKPEFDAGALAALVIFSLFLAVTVLSTGYDLVLWWFQKHSIHPLAIAFSLLTNGRKLFHLRGNQQLPSLNAIKALSMLWVVLGHVYMAYSFVPIDNYLDALDWLPSVHSQMITGATVAVDSFLVVAGFLVMYNFQRTKSNGKKFNLLAFYFHRYLRLTPALAAMVLAHVSLFNYLGDGPVWINTDVQLVRGCKQYWWSALLYVQNYVNPNGVCVPQSWYLSLDMQLFILSPIFLFLIDLWPLWGQVLIGALSLASMLTGFLVGWFFEINGLLSGNILNGNSTDFMRYYYMPTHTRMTPYLFGIILGYHVYNFKKVGRRFNLKIVYNVALWAIAIALLATCIFSGREIQGNTNRVDNSFFIALSRPVWALALCWIVFACVMDLAKPVNAFFSLKIFEILSRISYSIYLTHYAFIFLTSFAIRSPQHFNDYNGIHKFWGDLAFTLILSVIWSLMFESPVIVIEKLIFGQKQDKSSGKSNGRKIAAA